MVMDTVRAAISDNGTVQTEPYEPPAAIAESLRYKFNASHFYRADNNRSSYSRAHSINQSYNSTANLRLKEYQGRVVLFGSNSTAAYFYAYHDNGTHFSEVKSFVVGNLSSPVVKVSPQLTKAIIIAYELVGGTMQLVSFGWHLAYSSRTAENMTVPLEFIASLHYTEIILIENWIYFRQLKYTNSTTLREGVYMISEDTIPVLLEEKVISETAKWNWNNTRIVVLADNGNLKVITQLNTNTSETDWQRYEVSLDQAETQEGPLQNVNTAVSGNETVTCPVGCTDCSVLGLCVGETCLAGYVYITTSEICEECGENCLTCDPDDPDHCYTCGNGSYLVGN